MWAARVFTSRRVSGRYLRVAPFGLVGRRLKYRFTTSLETLVRYLVRYFLQGRFSWIVLLCDDYLPCCKDVEDILNVSLYHVLPVCRLSFVQVWSLLFPFSSLLCPVRLDSLFGGLFPCKILAYLPHEESLRCTAPEDRTISDEPEYLHGLFCWALSGILVSHGFARAVRLMSTFCSPLELLSG